MTTILEASEFSKNRVGRLRHSINPTEPNLSKSRSDCNRAFLIFQNACCLNATSRFSFLIVRNVTYDCARRKDHATISVVRRLDHTCNQRRDDRCRNDPRQFGGIVPMLAIVTLISNGEVQSVESFANDNVGLASAANHLVLKRLAYGPLARYTIETFDGSEVFSL